MKARHSWPGWTTGPRGYHPKFGGSIIIGGIPMVADRLRMQKLNYPEDLTSGHVLHEFATGINAYSALNSPNAISWADLEKGIRNGDFPMICGVTAPAFGINGAQFGAILHPDKSVSHRARDLHKEAIEMTGYFKEQGLGHGVAIWWPAGDSRLASFGGWSQDIRQDEAEEQLIEFWADLLQETGGMMWLEWKPAVPGGLDYLPTPYVANAFCEEVNLRLGRKAMLRNDEWAHCLIAGYSVLGATKSCIEAALFKTLVHVNSAQRAIVNWSADGKMIVEGTPGEDFDWPVGYAMYDQEAIWDDQQAAVSLIAKSVLDNELVIFEHDIDPAGRESLAVYRQSRENLEKMIEAAQAT